MSETGGDARSRLFCLPHAGGSAAVFQSWRKTLDPQIELCSLQYPGRGTRLDEDAITELDTLIGELATAIAPLTDRPYALFGHSLGALLAFEVTRALGRGDARMPSALFLSACRAPMLLPSPFIVEAAALPEDAFITALRTLGGVPEDLIEEPAFREVLLASTRSDFDLVSRYRYRATAPLDVPATLLYGQTDKHITGETLRDWRVEFTEAPAVRRFPGGHFYLEADPVRNDILALVTDALTPDSIVARI
ncbi:MAG: thioesterase [Rhodobacteraceae bacterium]|nr:thioesterase [Paracoccaceae bacterium]